MDHLCLHQLWIWPWWNANCTTSWLAWSLESKVLCIYADGAHESQWTHVDVVCAAACTLYTCGLAHSSLLHLSCFFLQHDTKQSDQHLLTYLDSKGLFCHTLAPWAVLVPPSARGRWLVTFQRDIQHGLLFFPTVKMDFSSSGVSGHSLMQQELEKKNPVFSS